MLEFIDRNSGLLAEQTEPAAAGLLEENLTTCDRYTNKKMIYYNQVQQEEDI